VLERGAIEGEIFHRGAVQALTDGRHLTPRLAALVRKGLIRPDTAQLPGEDAFRFRHLLIRDAAYNALPKARRAQLHERFASCLEQKGKELRPLVRNFELAFLTPARLDPAPRGEVERRVNPWAPTSSGARAARGGFGSRRFPVNAGARGLRPYSSTLAAWGRQPLPR
jgi:hypothetical protein